MNPQPLLVVLGVSTAAMLGGWLVRERTRNPAIADLVWAACISASALYYGVVAGGSMLSRLLVAMMAGIGGFRLFMHLLQRMLGETPDARARARIQQGDPTPLRTFGTFLAKAVSVTLFSVPLYVAATNPVDEASAWTLAAAGVYLIGLSGEAYADVQLSTFRDQPRNRGRTCRRGLWRYSRHPNYFFAFVHWCSYALLAVGLPRPLWSLTLLGPVLVAITAIRRIPIIEAQALNARGEDYRAYQASTSVFIPWPPANAAQDPSAASWYAPPSSHAKTFATPRSTPLPGARMTPPPASRLAGLPDGPVTPRPQRVLDQHREAKGVDETPSSLPAADVDG